MTTLLLVRHAHCDHVGVRLVGRMPGVHLDADGRAEADRLAARLSGLSLDAVYTSPLERARETAERIAAQARAPLASHPGLTEIDFGEWTGKSLDELSPLEAWRTFNISRATAPVPGGECMARAQARAVCAVEEIAARHRNRIVVAVSHADMIRAVLLAVLGVPLDQILRIEVAPASVSVIELAGDVHQARVLRVNDVGAVLDGDTRADR